VSPHTKPSAATVKTELTIDRDGTVSRARVTGGAASVALPREGLKYWVDASSNPWVDRACDRFERLNHVLRRMPVVVTRHEVLKRNGLWVVIEMKMTRADGAWVATARDVPGSPVMQEALGTDAGVMLGLGDGALACIVDKACRCWWWPWAMVASSGSPALFVLGGPPPVCYPAGEQVEPPAPGDAHIGISVHVGRRRIAASLTTTPLAHGQADLWLFEQRPERIYLYKPRQPKRPLS
jgi:hypothetical protein